VSLDIGSNIQLLVYPFFLLFDMRVHPLDTYNTHVPLSFSFPWPSCTVYPQPGEMPNSTPLISNAAAGDDASGGGTNDEETAGVLCHYSTTASRAPPRLELKVDAPLLRLIKKFMRSHAAQVGLPQAAGEDHGEHARRKGRRKLGRVAARSLQIGQRKVHTYI
jgi:hypothetical protein